MKVGKLTMSPVIWSGNKEKTNTSQLETCIQGVVELLTQPKSHVLYHVSLAALRLVRRPTECKVSMPSRHQGLGLPGRISGTGCPAAQC